MNIIVPMNKDIFNIIGNQTYYPDKKYIVTSYQIATTVGNMCIRENVLTRQVIIYPIDTPIKEHVQFLVENWFLLPEDVSEKSLSYIVRYAIKSKRERNQNGAIDCYTIFTTLACNARCPYCYEKGRAQKHMSEEVADAALKFISEKRKANKVTFNWFGGEPLANGQVITKMCKYMQENKIPYQSSMISNGYLFYKYSDTTIKDVWKLQHVQITLDGTAENYNRIKNYVESPENAFGAVIENIHRLLRLGVRVVIRLNLSAENGKDLLELVDYLAEEFSKCRNITAYAHPLFGCTIQPLSQEEWAEVYDGYIKIDQKLKSCSLRSYPGIDSVITCNCMADNGHSVCITPDGTLTMCEHYSDEEIVGDVWNGFTDHERLAEWRSMADEYDRCAKCWRYPKCYRLKKCQVEDECAQGMLTFWEYTETQALERAYARYVKNLEKEREAKKPFDKQTLIDLALGEVGKTLEDRDYWNELFPETQRYGWCTAFLYAIFNQAYPSKISTVLRGAIPGPHPFQMAMTFRRSGYVYDTPEVGDIVFYRVHTWISHVGLVVAVSEDGKTFDSVEGNIVCDGTTKVCKILEIPVSNPKVIGFGRPNFQNMPN